MPSAGSGVVGAAPCAWMGGLSEESRHEVNLHTTPSGSSAVCCCYFAFLILRSKQNVLLHPPESISQVS